MLLCLMTVEKYITYIIFLTFDYKKKSSGNFITYFNFFLLHIKLLLLVTVI